MFPWFVLSIINANFSQIKRDSCQYCENPTFLGHFQAFEGQCTLFFPLKFYPALKHTQVYRLHQYTYQMYNFKFTLKLMKPLLSVYV